MKNIEAFDAMIRFRRENPDSVQYDQRMIAILEKTLDDYDDYYTALCTAYKQAKRKRISLGEFPELTQQLLEAEADAKKP